MEVQGSYVQELQAAHKARLNRLNSGWSKPKPVLQPVDPAPYYPGMWFGDLVFKLPTPGEIFIRRVTISKIQKLVCERFDLTQNDLLSCRRTVHIAKARHLGYLLARELTRTTFMEIAMRFNRDHSSVLSGIARMKVRIAKDPAMAAEYQ